MTARKTGGTGGWDEFWAEVSGGRTETIRGVQVTVPTDIPLAMEQRINELQDAEDEDSFAELIALLFGTDALGAWREGGMGLRELKTVLAWGIAHANGQDMTFAEAYDLVMQEEAGGGKTPAPKGPNRAARRAQSTRTGGPSKPTSRASTGSARKTSRG
ncbi:hypothetical protein [Streptomyces sp. NPDC058614]|uniref:hypothetical protein n=1 Tax=Streptomyces sp. NPDC058614 TaxID=3346557 RepID=UPI00364A1661